ncbi:unnamed protein product [Citrullus colocynthis]|uniref:Transmembrane protein n=1 Tax=Citrullus colocynthis TaxID=252529 RepID=A0ABP0XPT2_9ROSI
MDKPRILSILLLSCFLFLFLSPGFGVEMMGTVEQHPASLTQEKETSVGKWRKMMVQLEDDYHDPGPNNPMAMVAYNMAPSPATP